MHKIATRHTAIIRVLIATLLMVFTSQTFAAADNACEPRHDVMVKHTQMDMADMDASVALFGCCAESGCDMASCALLLQPDTGLNINACPEQTYSRFSERLESTPITTLLRPPIHL